jgi:Fic family protein
MVEGTLQNPEKAGALRQPKDKVYIEDVRSGDIVHMPPAADQLPERLEALCRFANGEDETEQYIHPVIRAIILHFQLAYDHPFVDGNGRTARALFYWGMLRAGYWLFEFISISREIFMHSRRYYDSFLNTEEDENDLNYFIINQLETILSSINSLMEYARNSQKTKDQFRQYIEKSLPFLNYRQHQVLLNFIQHPDTHTSVSIHCRTHNVVRQTARTDLSELVTLGLLYTENISREFIFKPKPDLEAQLRKIAENKPTSS